MACRLGQFLLHHLQLWLDRLLRRIPDLLPGKIVIRLLSV